MPKLNSKNIHSFENYFPFEIQHGKKNNTEKNHGTALTSERIKKEI